MPRGLWDLLYLLIFLLILIWVLRLLGAAI
jgi:hypothetical protein